MVVIVDGRTYADVIDIERRRVKRRRRSEIDDNIVGAFYLIRGDRKEGNLAIVR